ncbi:hypothetical protein [Bosea sp. LC85]|nr:hypothetical protein [Bosea sp. LC85]
MVTAWALLHRFLPELRSKRQIDFGCGFLLVLLFLLIACRKFRAP